MLLQICRICKDRDHWRKLLLQIAAS